MLNYIIRRVLYMTILLLILSVVAFAIIQLPPGDYLTLLVENMRARGLEMQEAEILALENQYGLGLPVHLQYFKWMWNLLQGDMGRSFQWNEPVTRLIGERLMLTVVI